MILTGYRVPLLVTVGAIAFASIVLSAPDSRQNPKQSAKLQKGPKANDTCGTVADVAMKVQVCAKPLMDIMQGTVEKWPADDADVQELCQSFAGSERCIRDVGRRCAKGLQKTIISRILKTTQCVERYQDLVHTFVANATNRLDVVEHQMRDLDQKTNGVCCMVHEIEKDLKVLFQPRCPNESVIVIRLYRAVLEDVLDLICRSPKCNDIFRGFKIPNGNDFSGIVAVLLRIVFSLG